MRCVRRAHMTYAPAATRSTRRAAGRPTAWAARPRAAPAAGPAPAAAAGTGPQGSAAARSGSPASAATAPTGRASPAQAQARASARRRFPAAAARTPAACRCSASPPAAAPRPASPLAAARCPASHPATGPGTPAASSRCSGRRPRPRSTLACAAAGQSADYAPRPCRCRCRCRGAMEATLSRGSLTTSIFAGLSSSRVQAKFGRISIGDDTTLKKCGQVCENHRRTIWVDVLKRLAALEATRAAPRAAELARPYMARGTRAGRRRHVGAWQHKSKAHSALHKSGAFLPE